MWPHRGDLNGNYNLRNNENPNVSPFRIFLVERLPYCSLPTLWNEFDESDNIMH